MSNKFDELAKGMAASVTRRQAVKRFGVGLAVTALACFGLADKAKAEKGGCKASGAPCKTGSQCCSGICYIGFKYKNGNCG